MSGGKGSEVGQGTKHEAVASGDAVNHQWAEGSRELLAAIVSASDDAIISKSLDGTILSWNAGAERLFGYSAAEMIGKSINLIIPERLQAEEQSILARLGQGERIEHFETVRVAKDGREIFISLTISPVRDTSGRVVGASKIARNITEKKRTEQALQASEERFRELANNIDQFAWTCDELGYATWYNQRWYDYTGTTFEQVRGDGWRAVHHPDYVDQVAASLARGVESEEPWEAIFPMRGKDGEYRWFLSRAIPIRDADGRVIRWFGSNTDITEQRELELALRDADRRKDEFLATLSHELRNPLAAISSSLEVLNRAGDDPELVSTAHDAIGRQTSHLVRLVDDLLDVSRITRDRIELQKSRVELDQILCQAIEVCLPLSEQNGQTIHRDVPAEALYLDADPVRLQQIVSNLLTNACNFSPPGGSIRLTATPDNEYVQISVSDDGEGIAPEHLETIFEIFTQGRPSSERPTRGLGVGLSLVRRLVDLHGGSVGVRSEGLGKGSEFTVRLPLAADPGVAESSREPASYSRNVNTGNGARRILVVDDNVDNAESLSMLLSMNGHETRVAFDGLVALELAAQFRPQVVLLDIGLPKMNGLDVCRHIRKEPWGGEIKIIAVTGWGQDIDRQRSADAGFDHHLVKPVQYSHIEQALASSRAGN
jgi:PAS domain S-box-containing protein